MLFCFRETIRLCENLLALNATALTTAPRKDIAVYATQLICASGAPSIATYRQKLKGAQTLGHTLMCIFGVGLFSANRVKYAVKQKQKNTTKIMISRLRSHGCAVSVI